MLGISPTLWILIGLVVAAIVLAFTVGRLVKFGPTRILFLAPAFLFFSVFVVYPIGGSAWISLHDAKSDRLICTDGRTLQELPLGERCRKILDMKWIGLDHYQKLLLGDWEAGEDGARGQFRLVRRNGEKLGAELSTLGTWAWSGLINTPARIYNLGASLVGGELTEIEQAKSPRYPRLSDTWEALINNILWMVMFQVAIPISLALAVLLNQNTLAIRLIKPAFFFPFIIAPAVIAFLFKFFYNPDVGGLTAINPELVEAGSLDGARGFKLFRLIILPQLWPATFICVVVTTIGALRSFDLINIMTGGQFKTKVLAFESYDSGFSENGGNYGESAALSMLLFAIMLFFIAFFVTRMVRQTEG